MVALGWRGTLFHSPRLARWRTLNMRMLTTLAALASACALAAPAQAAIMTAIITGHVGYGEDSAGLFGAPGGVFMGETYVVTYIYDPDRANRITTPTYDFAVGGVSSGVVLNPLTP